jgi:hypothetical protein
MGASVLMCANEIKQVQALVLSDRNRTGIKKFHVMLGHALEKNTRKAANRLGIKLTGQLTACEECILAKIRQKTSIQDLRSLVKVFF